MCVYAAYALLRHAEPAGCEGAPASGRQAHNEHHDFVRLDGGSGRAVFFRPQRLTVGDLRPLSLTIVLGDTGVQAELLDISQSGIGVDVPADTVGMNDGAIIAGVALYVDGEPLHAGDVFVAVSRPSESSRRLGLSLTNSMIDIDALTTVRDIGRWDQAHNAPLSSIGSPWAAARQETVLADLGPMDAVFSTGLFDYLDDAFAAKLTGRLYQLVRPGGWVAIGNMDYANPNRWVMEHLLDWWLIFRSQDEMRAFVKAGAPDAVISMRFEPTGINPFVVLTRPES